MSSSVSESTIQKGKVLIHVAENGQSFELDCYETSLVESLQRFLESVSGINFNDQLLLCLDMKLEPQKPLSVYKLPSNDREVFLFNRARMRSNSTPPLLEKIKIIEIPDPPSPSLSLNPHPLDDAPDPALKALPSYERQFRYHYQYGHAIYTRTQYKFEACERLMREQKVQERALEIARDNLNHFYRMIHQNFTDFIKRYSQQHRSHSSLLMNLGREIEKLRSCKLIPVLQTGTRKCLLDFVKEENLRKAADDCSGSHRQFENKVLEFKQEFGELKHSAEELFNSKAAFLVRDLEVTMKEHYRFVNEQKTIMQALSKDVSTVKKLIEDCLSSQLSSSLRPHDAVSALGPMYDSHEKNYLPKIQECDRVVSNLIEFCKEKKNEMNVFVHNYMQKIAYIQYTIKDIRIKFSVFTEAMKRQNDQFEYLKVVRGIGSAYRACLAEIVRRKASMKLYMGMAGQLAEKLATKREVEVRRREEFLKINSSFIPRDILDSMGLYDNPNQCDVNITPFDTNLLDIDISDLDRFAPEYLLGSSKHVSLKGSLTMSEAGESGIESSEEVLEGSELVEIAGTSKLEVENAKLKAELASAIALICSFNPDIEYESLDDSRVDSLLKNAAEKTAEALNLKDEYGKHLQSMLKTKQTQCESYEKRIRELEERLSDQTVSNSLLDVKCGDSKSEICVTSEPMDEASFIPNSFQGKISILAKQGLDENMAESSSMVNNPQLDSSMLELSNEKDGKDAIGCEMGMVLATSGTDETAEEKGLDIKASGDFELELRKELLEKSDQLSDTEVKLKSMVDEVAKLGKELEISRKLLDESQMNCAHLENCLHEAREEAQTHLCAADRRASEYSALRASALKMRTLFERLRSCLSSGGVVGLADSLRALAQSLANSTNASEDDGVAEYRECIRVLADKVGTLARNRAELLDRYQKSDASIEQLKKELEEKKEMVNTLYVKHQHEKQVSKEKISFVKLEVHEIAAFVLNSLGHYEAIHRNCHNYYLSTESVALFLDHLSNRPGYIIGQIVHIERQVVRTPRTTPASTESKKADFAVISKSTSNPYGLPVGCEYFIVTVAMLPEMIIRSPSSS